MNKKYEYGCDPQGDFDVDLHCIENKLKFLNLTLITNDITGSWVAGDFEAMAGFLDDMHDQVQRIRECLYPDNGTGKGG